MILSLLGFDINFAFCNQFRKRNWRAQHGFFGVIQFNSIGLNLFQLFIKGSETLGEIFDPAKDCSDIVDRVPDAKDGFYWIQLGSDKMQKV